jgi:hypothetical protein
MFAECLCKACSCQPGLWPLAATLITVAVMLGLVAWKNGWPF